MGTLQIRNKKKRKVNKYGKQELFKKQKSYSTEKQKKLAFPEF